MHYILSVLLLTSFCCLNAEAKKDIDPGPPTVSEKLMLAKHSLKISIPTCRETGRIINFSDPQKGWRHLTLSVEQLNSENGIVGKWEVDLSGDIALLHSAQRPSEALLTNNIEISNLEPGAQQGTEDLPIVAHLLYLNGRCYRGTEDIPFYNFWSHPSQRHQPELFGSTRLFRLLLRPPTDFFWKGLGTLGNSQPKSKAALEELPPCQQAMVAYAKQCFLRECELAYVGRNIGSQPQACLTYNCLTTWGNSESQLSTFHCVGLLHHEERKDSKGKVTETCILEHDRQLTAYFILPHGRTLDCVTRTEFDSRGDEAIELGSFYTSEGERVIMVDTAKSEPEKEAIAAWIEVSWQSEAGLDCEVRETVVLLGEAENLDSDRLPSYLAAPQDHAWKIPARSKITLRMKTDPPWH